MMNITQRRPIWVELSKFYLDTELEDEDFKTIAATILKSPYSLEEIKAINRYEVFPVLQANLSGGAGVWDAFDEEWMVERITTTLTKRTVLHNFGNNLLFWMNAWMHKGSWRKLQNAYHELK